jgi:hypothetical protein
MPHVNAEHRRARDALVLRLFLAGWSYRQIGAHPRVRLSAKGVGNVINAELSAEVAQRGLGVQARQVYVTRLENLLRSSWPKALAGDLKAAEHCLHVLALEARYWGLGV